VQYTAYLLVADKYFHDDNAVNTSLYNNHQQYISQRNSFFSCSKLRISNLHLPHPHIISSLVLSSLTSQLPISHHHHLPPPNPHPQNQDSPVPHPNTPLMHAIHAPHSPASSQRTTCILPTPPLNLHSHTHRDQKLPHKGHVSMILKHMLTFQTHPSIPKRDVENVSQVFHIRTKCVGPKFASGEHISIV
jgi:hypothetical protein